MNPYKNPRPYDESGDAADDDDADDSDEDDESSTVRRHVSCAQVSKTTWSHLGTIWTHIGHDMETSMDTAASTVKYRRGQA